MSFKKAVPQTTKSKPSGSKKWTKIGAILKSKNNNSGFYIKIDQDVSLKKGDYVTVKNPRETVEELLSKGVLTEEQAQERLQKIPDWVKYELIVSSES